MWIKILGFFLTPVRLVLGVAVLVFERAFRPRPQVTRDPAEQARVDRETRDLVLYQFETCPFCVKVRRHALRLGLKLELRDARRSPEAERELVEGGGERQVPCLRIAEPGGGYRWLYESSEINAYLSARFASEG